MSKLYDIGMYKIGALVTMAYLAAQILGLGNIAFAGQDPGFCSAYARTAVQENNQNLRRGCGFTGPRWQSDFRVHYDWCMRQGPGSNAPAFENNARIQALASCRAPSQPNFNSRQQPVRSPAQQYCASYAHSAVRANIENLRRGCGFTGPRWQSNFNVHYDWCMRQGPGSNGPAFEARARRWALRSCH